MDWEDDISSYLLIHMKGPEEDKQYRMRMTIALNDALYLEDERKKVEDAEYSLWQRLKAKFGS